MNSQERRFEQFDDGFTLVELLIAIVVVGVLTAVAVLGITGVVDKGETSACQASADAAKAASSVFYANTGSSSFPADFHSLIAPKVLYEIPNGVTPQVPGVGDVALVGKGWTLEMTPGTASQPPTFSCT
jgi:prepilin-type N-terminal cleavage/methylation domain-containing protein